MFDPCFRNSVGEIIYEEVIEKDLAEKVLKYLLDLRIDFEVNTDHGDFTTNGLETTSMLVIANSDEYPNAEYISGMEVTQNETEICRFE